MEDQKQMWVIVGIVVLLVVGALLVALAPPQQLQTTTGLFPTMEVEAGEGMVNFLVETVPINPTDPFPEGPYTVAIDGGEEYPPIYCRYTYRRSSGSPDADSVCGAAYPPGTTLLLSAWSSDPRILPVTDTRYGRYIDYDWHCSARDASGQRWAIKFAKGWTSGDVVLSEGLVSAKCQFYFSYSPSPSPVPS